MSADLDADAGDGPFEGPEKLLEIWFAPTVAELATQTASSSTAASRPGSDWLGLRRVPREVWEEMLDIVKCKVLSFVEGEEMDAYLLSESSFFVFPNKLIMKTCGTTLNLLGLPRILAIAKEYSGLESVWRCFYSRKSFMFPDRQKGPHKGGWETEVDFLDDIFDNGAAYTVGPMNGDHWLLYVTAPRNADQASSSSAHPPQLPPPTTTSSTKDTSSSNDNYASSSSALEDALASAALHFPSNASTIKASSAVLSTSPARPSHMPVSASSSTAAVERPLRLPNPGTVAAMKPRDSGDDQTLEVLMTHLSAKGRAQFYPPSASSVPSGSEPGGSSLGEVISQACGLSALFPASSTTLDSYAFTPCGYSANALVHSPVDASEGYWTVHVTPEATHSYASFESNIALPSTASPVGGFPDLRTLIRNVVEIFEPGRLTLTLFLSSEEAATEEGWGKGAKVLAEKTLLPGYRRRDRIGYEFEGYDLIFITLEREGWTEDDDDQEDLLSVSSS